MTPFSLMDNLEDVPYLLSTVDGWEDPMPKPVLERHEGVWVVRDDLLEVGAKSRFADCLIGRTESVREWVYGSSPRCGYGQISLAYTCRKYRKGCVLFVAEGNDRHENTKLAERYGAIIKDVSTGFLATCEAKARQYADEDRGGRRLIPMGLRHPMVFGAIIKVARSLPIKPREVWVAAGSGTLSCGLQLAWPNARHYAVSVGHKLSLPEIRDAEVIHHPQEFTRPCPVEDRPPFPSVANHDAKVWRHLMERSDRKKTVLFWNVGADLSGK